MRKTHRQYLNSNYPLVPVRSWVTFIFAIFMLILAGNYCYGEHTSTLKALGFSFFSLAFSIGVLFLFFSTLEARGFVRKFVVAANKNVVFRVESHHKMGGMQFLSSEKEKIEKLCLYMCDRHLVSTVSISLSPWALIPDLENVPLIFVTIKPSDLVGKNQGFIKKQVTQLKKGTWCEVGWRGDPHSTVKQIVHHIGHVLLNETKRYDEQEQDEIMKNARLDSLLARTRAVEKKDKIKDRRFLS